MEGRKKKKKKLAKLQLLCFPGGLDGKQSACSVGDPGLIPGLGRSPWKREWLTIPTILAWRISWTEEPGRLQSLGCKESDMTLMSIIIISKYDIENRHQ